MSKPDAEDCELDVLLAKQRGAKNPLNHFAFCSRAPVATLVLRFRSNCCISQRGGRNDMAQRYQVIGTMSVSGNSSNPGVGQSINYSFELDYANAGSSFGLPTVVGQPVITCFGPLGNFDLKVISIQGYIGFFSPLAELDLLFQTLTSPPPPVVSGESWLYSCTVVSTGPCAPFYTGSDIYGTACAKVYEIPALDRPVPWEGVRHIQVR
jgi:hypothetical protein